MSISLLSNSRQFDFKTTASPDLGAHPDSAPALLHKLSHAWKSIPAELESLSSAGFVRDSGLENMRQKIRRDAFSSVVNAQQHRPFSAGCVHCGRMPFLGRKRSPIAAPPIPFILCRLPGRVLTHRFPGPALAAESDSEPTAPGHGLNRIQNQVVENAKKLAFGNRRMEAAGGGKVQLDVDPGSGDSLQRRQLAAKNFQQIQRRQAGGVTGCALIPASITHVRVRLWLTDIPFPKIRPLEEVEERAHHVATALDGAAQFIEPDLKFFRGG
jgi:hypothetical protein